MTVESVNDSYLTIDGEAEAIYKQLSSKFLAYAYHVTSEEQIRQLLDALRKRYYDATHHCYAYRLGHDGALFRANDDGEPSSTAGRPILGQLLSNELTDCLIVVVRYFGGTKLGVPGLIQAYKESAAAVIAQSKIVSRTVDITVEVTFSYVSMNDIMRIVKDMQPRIAEQRFDNLCTMRLAIRSSQADELIARLSKVEGAAVEPINE
ncbi:MAG: YigZ family protein [Alistipes sp.]|nr:YigZ family protein [Alistipes sp.]